MAEKGTNKTFLFLMLGYPGSGKSYAAEWLAPHMEAVHLRSDDMRLEMFGEERLEFHENWKYQRQVHGAMQYAARQILISRHPVVYDANHNSRKSRRPMQKIAQELNAIPILVWVKTPLELAKKRVLEREAAGGLKIFDIGFVERMAANLQPPEEDELSIELDGQQSAEEQRTSFDSQLASILAGKVQ
jgi:predicted kinase